MILQQDGLRTPTLLARDAANLAAALCASTQQMDGAWRVIAARGAGGEGFAGTTAEGEWKWVWRGWVVAQHRGKRGRVCCRHSMPLCAAHRLFECIQPIPLTLPAALEAAKAAVKGDPARSQRCTTTTAKQDYRLSDKDLAVRGGCPELLIPF